MKRGRERTGLILLFFILFFLQTPKMSRAFFGLFGKQGTGHTHGLLDVLVGQCFLGSFANFLFDHLLRFSFYTACQPCFQPLKTVTGGFQGISCPFKPAETSANHVHYQPSSILIVFVGSKSRQTATDHVDFQQQLMRRSSLAPQWMRGSSCLYLYSTRLTTSFSHVYVFLKCNVTMVLPGPNLVRSPLVSATLVSTMSTTSLRRGMY